MKKYGILAIASVLILSLEAWYLASSFAPTHQSGEAGETVVEPRGNTGDTSGDEARDIKIIAPGMLVYRTPMTVGDIRPQERRGEQVTRTIASFSALVDQVFLKNLGLNDKNNNGVIDRGAGEGYEEFIARYGDADHGFVSNGIILGAYNGKLEENEILNHYYIHIRFKNEAETTLIEQALEAQARSLNLPLIWLDDEHQTVLNTVKSILNRRGISWPREQVSTERAMWLFSQVMEGLQIRGMTGLPSDTGYFLMPELISRRAGYCFEVAQFGFWFFSQLRINTLTVEAMLSPTVQHEVIKLTDDNIIIDHFKSSLGLGLTVEDWSIANPLQSISDYCSAEAEVRRNRRNQAALLEQAVLYNKYDISDAGFLMESLVRANNPNYRKILARGEYILQNIDIGKIMAAEHLKADQYRNNLEITLSILLECYHFTKNRGAFDETARLLMQYYRSDPKVKPYIAYYDKF
jgi:hypothetical protein